MISRDILLSIVEMNLKRLNILIPIKWTDSLNCYYNFKEDCLLINQDFFIWLKSELKKIYPNIDFDIEELIEFIICHEIGHRNDEKLTCKVNYANTLVSILNECITNMDISKFISIVTEYNFTNELLEAVAWENAESLIRCDSNYEKFSIVLKFCYNHHLEDLNNKSYEAVNEILLKMRNPDSCVTIHS